MRYFEYLDAHPEMVNSIILWTVTVFVCWFVLFREKPTMIDGAKGENKLFDLPEQVSYLILWLLPPVLSYFAFFQNLVLTLYFLGGVVAYTIGGRWLFQWFLALRAGQTKVDEQKTDTPQ